MKKLVIIPITLLILSCTNMDNKTKTEHNLSSQIEYQDNVNTKIYFESDAYKMILFAMKKERILKLHKVP